MMSLIFPDWPAPPVVKAASTTRTGGVSRPPYASLNLGGHVGDAAAAVSENRRRLRDALGLRSEPQWLQQVHGVNVLRLAGQPSAGGAADAAVTGEVHRVCAVLTADCLPVLLCDVSGQCVGIAHAGWRGLLAGVIEATVAAMSCPAASLMAWLGPGIGAQRFEVGSEVRERFLLRDPAAVTAFAPSPGGRWLADLYALARKRLARAGVSAVYGGGYCTMTDSARFFSYRRDGQCGRMASLIWLEEPARTD